MLPAKRTKHDECPNAAGPLNQEQIPPILTFDIIYIDTLFEYFSLKDLCSIGRTCKRLYRATGLYFKEYFPMSAIEIGRNSVGTIEQCIFCTSILTNFAPYARHIVIYGNDVEVYKHATTIKFQNIEQIEFLNAKLFTEDHYLCLTKMMYLEKNEPKCILGKISTIRIYDCSETFTDKLLDRILPLCVALKYLILFSEDYMKEQHGNWLHQTIPTLVGLKNANYLTSNDLKTFLQANPQIKELSNGYRNISEIIQNIDLKLDYFEWSVISIEDVTRNQLVALKENGHFQNLNLDLYSGGDDDDDDNIKDLSTVSCFTSLRISTFDFLPDLSPLVNLRKLYLDQGEMTSEQAELLSKSLINLEELYCLIDSGSRLDIMPFVCRLPKLRIIEGGYISNINVEAMNDIRKKLPNAEKLMIFLRDEAYQEVRWTSIDLFLDMVEVKRAILKHYVLDEIPY